jgi:inhibitor of the pro-sigma K processing machinery
MMKLVSNSVVGAFMLFVADFFGLGIEITILKALFAGICGIPGVLIIIIWEKFLAG